MRTELFSTQQTVTITRNGPVIIIGERINPTGKPALADALAAGNMDPVRRLAREQIENGADLLDVNVGAAGVDEDEILPLAVKTVADEVDAPIVIDSTHETALEAALKVCPGKPLINSVNGEEASLKRVLPLVQEYGTAVIGLTMDDAGIPDTAEGRFAIAETILDRAVQQGIPEADVIIDCLALTVGADSTAAMTTLRTVQMVKDRLDLNVCLGVSNVSFGLPQRTTINNLFIAMAMFAGMSVAIVNPSTARETMLIVDMLMGRDEFATRYLDHFRAKKETD